MYSFILNTKIKLCVDNMLLDLYNILVEQEAENDGESGGAEDEGPQADHQRHGEAG